VGRIAVVGTVGLAALREEALSVDEVLAAVGDDGSGGAVLFVGTVRDHDEGRGVASLRYEAHPAAERLLAEVVERIAAEPAVRRVAALHRIGELKIGDIAVVVAAAGAHRAEAFDAARRLIDDIKSTVPIWKLQRFADGSDEWVGSP
jgi:molybdopterin synthase catalytic subunit